MTVTLRQLGRKNDLTGDETIFDFRDTSRLRERDLVSCSMYSVCHLLEDPGNHSKKQFYLYGKCSKSFI